MKQTLTALALLALIGAPVMAATPTPTPKQDTVTGTPTPTSKIDDLKERLATKVAELRQTQKKAIFGTVTAVSVSTFTVETETTNYKLELTDDIAVVQTIKGKRTLLAHEDIEKDDTVAVLGEFDTGLDLLRARVVVIQAKPLDRISGTVTEIDRKNFTTTVTTDAGVAYLVDIEKSTATLTFDRQKGLVKGGFSKLETGHAVHVIGSAVAKADKRISAARLIDLGNLTGATPTPTPTPEITPTATASGTPRATPRASGTPRATATPAGQ